MEARLFPKVKPSHRHWYAYDVEFDGDLIVMDSRDPEHDLARALLSRGITGHVRLIGPGCTGAIIHRTTINIERAAQWCVGSNLERYRWRGAETSDYSPPAGERAAEAAE
jgi:hypothetical protein